MIGRRGFLRAASASWFVAAFAPGISFARAPTDRRLVFIMLRGGMDGLEAVMPVGDPAWSGIGGRQDPLPNPVALDGFFHLHANLARLVPLVAARELIVVHAVASPYRDRSHFDAQNVVETGGRRAYERKEGWLTRLVGALGGDAGTAVAAADRLPAALRGGPPFGAYPNPRLGMPEADLRARLSRLWAGDPELAGIWDQALQAERILAGLRGGSRVALAAHMLAHPEGPRIAMLETGGFDTHSNQKYRLGHALRLLEQILLELREGLGPHWKSTLVIAATEFGRTVALGGAAGTDHGTGTAALLAGGALAGWGLSSPVVADWPGLRPGQLLDNRDLRPTRDLRGVLLAASARHFGLDPRQLSPVLFPDRAPVAPDPAFL